MRGLRIEAVGPGAELPVTADEVIDAHDQIVMPGLVNTHHHRFQTLTRAVPAAQDTELLGSLQKLCPIWVRITPEMLHVSTQIAMAELLLSGCTPPATTCTSFPTAAGSTTPCTTQSSWACASMPRAAR